MSEWKEHKLGDICDLISGYAFKSKNFLDCQIEGTLPVIKIKNVANGDVNLNDVVYHLYDDKLANYKLSKDDVLIAMTGNHIHAQTQIVGDVSMYKLDNVSLLNQRVGKVIIKSKANLKFIYYFFKDEETKYDLAIQASGSANQANISKDNILSLDINLPPLPEQRAIASVLSSLDDKIDLLRRQNKTLEKMAETLFRQWFVDNEGIGKKRIGNVVDFAKGRKPSEVIENYFHGAIPQLLIEVFDTGKIFYTKQDGMLIADKKDLLMVMDGASSGRVEIGYVGAVGSTIGLFRPVKGFNFPLFLYHFLKTNEGFIKENTTGSAIPHADKALILDLEFSYSNIDRVIQFEKGTQTWFDKKQLNNKQIKTLTQLRDTLLPKLMSGEVRVSN